MRSLEKQGVTVAAHETVEGRQLDGSKTINVPGRDMSILKRLPQLQAQMNRMTVRIEYRRCSWQFPGEAVRREGWGSCLT